MYTGDHLALGEAPPEPAAPSLWDSFANLASKAVSTGFNIYNKVQNIQQTNKSTAALNQQAAQIAAATNYALTQPMTGVQANTVPVNVVRYPSSGGVMDGWTFPLLAMGAAVIGFVALRRK